MLIYLHEPAQLATSDWSLIVKMRLSKKTGDCVGDLKSGGQYFVVDTCQQPQGSDCRYLGNTRMVAEFYNAVIDI